MKHFSSKKINYNENYIIIEAESVSAKQEENKVVF